ncbi:MAG TPA: hypothetical protein VF597_02290 [Candidatus Saccharimonadales bacterium]|jgi:hypothetical protein
MAVRIHRLRGTTGPSPDEMIRKVFRNPENTPLQPPESLQFTCIDEDSKQRVRVTLEVTEWRRETRDRTGDVVSLTGTISRNRVTASYNAKTGTSRFSRA